MNEYRLKYVPKPVTNRVRKDPEKYVAGADPIRRDKRYAWLKHRAQCKYRQEPYALSWEDWLNIWPDDLFVQRGRSKTSLCLMRVNMFGDWSVDNTVVATRLSQLKRNGEYRRG